jgi:hypothetical protein
VHCSDPPEPGRGSGSQRRSRAVDWTGESAIYSDGSRALNSGQRLGSRQCSKDLAMAVTYSNKRRKLNDRRPDRTFPQGQFVRSSTSATSQFSSPPTQFTFDAWAQPSSLYAPCVSLTYDGYTDSETGLVSAQQQYTEWTSGQHEAVPSQVATAVTGCVRNHSPCVGSSECVLVCIGTV